MFEKLKKILLKSKENDEIKLRNAVFVLWWISQKKNKNINDIKLPKKYVEQYNLDFSKEIVHLIKIGLLINSDNVLSISDAGKKYLEFYNCFIIMHLHPEYHLSYCDFCSNQEWHNIKDNDIIWGIFNKRQLEFTKNNQWDEYCQNSSNMATLLIEEEKYSNALEFVFEVAFIETSGMHNNNVLQHYDNTNGDFNVLLLEINNYLVTKPLNEIKAKLSLTLEELKSKFLYSQRVKAITALLPFYYLDSEECWKMIQYALEQGREKGIITLTDLSKSGSHIRFNVPKENSSTYFYNSIENVLKRKFS